MLAIPVLLLQLLVVSEVYAQGPGDGSDCAKPCDDCAFCCYLDTIVPNSGIPPDLVSNFQTLYSNCSAWGGPDDQQFWPRNGTSPLWWGNSPPGECLTVFDGKTCNSDGPVPCVVPCNCFETPLPGCCYFGWRETPELLNITFPGTQRFGSGLDVEISFNASFSDFNASDLGYCVAGGCDRNTFSGQLYNGLQGRMFKAYGDFCTFHWTGPIFYAARDNQPDFPLTATFTMGYIPTDLEEAGNRLVTEVAISGVEENTGLNVTNFNTPRCDNLCEYVPPGCASLSSDPRCDRVDMRRFGARTGDVAWGVQIATSYSALNASDLVELEEQVLSSAVQASFLPVICFRNTTSREAPSGDVVVIVVVAPEPCGSEEEEEVAEVAADETTSSPNGSLPLIIGLSASAGVLAFVAAAMGGVAYWRVQNMRNRIVPGKVGPIWIDDVQLGKKIGAGNLGDVFLAEWQGATVAVKTVQSANFEELAQEMEVLAELNHPNIVRSYGLCTLETEAKGIVLDFCGQGSLDDLLKKRWGAGDRFAESELFLFCVHAARGLAYLASQNVLHRDLAARNILLGDDQLARLTDFGLATIGTEQGEETPIPIRWSAPEVLKERNFSFASDVYSLGITMWEIYSHADIPFKHLPKNIQVVKAVVDGGERPQRPANLTSDAVWSAMTRAWAQDLIDRPTAKEMISLLDLKNATAIATPEKSESEGSLEEVNIEEGYGDGKKVGAKKEEAPGGANKEEQQASSARDDIFLREEDILAHSVGEFVIYLGESAMDGSYTARSKVSSAADRGNSTKTPTLTRVHEDQYSTPMESATEGQYSTPMESATDAGHSGDPSVSATPAIDDQYATRMNPVREAEGSYSLGSSRATAEKAYTTQTKIASTSAAEGAYSAPISAATPAIDGLYSTPTNPVREAEGSNSLGSSRATAEAYTTQTKPASTSAAEGAYSAPISASTNAIDGSYTTQARLSPIKMRRERKKGAKRKDARK